VKPGNNGWAGGKHPRGWNYLKDDGKGNLGREKSTGTFVPEESPGKIWGHRKVNQVSRKEDLISVRGSEGCANQLKLVDQEKENYDKGGRGPGVLFAKGGKLCR